MKITEEMLNDIGCRRRGTCGAEASLAGEILAARQVVAAARALVYGEDGGVGDKAIEDAIDAYDRMMLALGEP